MRTINGILFIAGLVGLLISPVIIGCKTSRMVNITVTLPQPVCDPIPGSLDMFGNVWTNTNIFSPAEVNYINRQNAAQGL